MTEKTINNFKNISHFILVFLSILLSVNLFIQFSDFLYIQILFSLMAIALELIKLFILMKSKSYFKEGGFKNDLVGIIQFLVYLGLAFISVIASLGFTLVSIEEQSIQFESRRNISNFRIESIQNEIEFNLEQIRIIQNNARDLEFSAVERVAQANEQVRAIQEENRNLINLIEELREENIEVIEERLTSKDMFVLLGDLISISGKDAMFYMMLVLVILLEVAIAITSGSISKPFQLKESSKGLMEYIDALFSEDGKRLVPDNRIHKILNISIEDSKMFRESLQSIVYKGKPMITSRRGGTVPNFSKENMKKIVQFHIDSGKIS